MGLEKKQCLFAKADQSLLWRKWTECSKFLAFFLVLVFQMRMLTHPMNIFRSTTISAESDRWTYSIRSLRPKDRGPSGFPVSVARTRMGIYFSRSRILMTLRPR